jgi:hypothetical protein
MDVAEDGRALCRLELDCKDNKDLLGKKSNREGISSCYAMLQTSGMLHS